MSSGLDAAALQQLLASGDLVLFSGQHAARLHRASLAQVTGMADARPPLAWHEWTSAVWSELLVSGGDDRILLNRLQEEQIWADVITRISRQHALAPSSIRDLAALSRSALQTAASYCFVEELRRNADTPDARTFHLWLEAFRERCSVERLIAPALLEHALVEALGSKRLSVPGPIHLVGFEQLTPAQERWLAELSKAGTAVHRHRLLGSSRAAVRLSVEVPDQRQELELAARWIAQETPRFDTERSRVALICPDPDTLRHDMERSLAEALAPELRTNFADLSSKPWQFARQPALATHPVIAAALEVAQWIAEPLPLERISQLLVSPFLRYSEGFELRSQYDLQAADPVLLLHGALSLPAFVEVARAGLGPKYPQVRFPELSALARAAREFGSDRSLRTTADWTERLRKLLSVVGWPGPRELTAAEFRATEGWETLLDLISTLQFDGSRVSYRQLVLQLAAEAQSFPASPESFIAPVQILTWTEAEGLAFDAVFYVEATEDTLPAVERRHPLLPQALQRRAGIGDAARAVQQATEALESLAERTSTLILLAPRSEDGASQMTPLATQLGFTAAPAAALPPVEPGPATERTEDITDPERMPLPSGGEIRGGIHVLQLQAACGFRAFAAHRLAAQEPSPTMLGLQARDLGSVLHLALEILWERLGNQQALKDLTRDARLELVRDCTQAAFRRKRLEARADDPWTVRYLQILKRRFVRLLNAWLDCELERSPFTVLSQEVQQTIEIGPLRLSVRPDRVDLVGGEKVFVDYKTSYQLSSNDWLGERPDAPQLPVYALSTEAGNLKGIAYAQVRPGDMMGWISLTETAGTFPRKRNKQVDLQEQRSAWQEELTSLAESFAQGDAGLSPKQYPQTCKYCGYRTLCRQDPTDLLREAEEDDENEEELLG